MTSLPELVAQRANRPAPPRYDVQPAFVALRADLRQAGVDTMGVTRDGPLVSVDRSAFASAGVDPDPMLRRFAQAARARPGIARVDRVRDLAGRDTVRDAVTRRWLHMIPSDSPVEYVITPHEGAYPVGATIAEHGAPYDDDARVPVIFYGPWFRAARIADRALVADMAPTLAYIVGVPPTERLDGRVLMKAIVSPRR